MSIVPGTITLGEVKFPRGGSLGDRYRCLGDSSYCGIYWVLKLVTGCMGLRVHGFGKVEPGEYSEAAALLSPDSHGSCFLLLPELCDALGGGRWGRTSHVFLPSLWIGMSPLLHTKVGV